MAELTSPITITLDKERHLRLSFRGMIEFEKLSGKSLLKGFNPDDMSMEDISTLVWASLIHEDKSLTLDALLDMIDMVPMVTVMTAVGECIKRAFSEGTEGDKRPLAKKRPHG
jgi:hypothetical protein